MEKISSFHEFILEIQSILESRDQTDHLQSTPSQFLVTVLKDSRVFEDLMW